MYFVLPHHNKLWFPRDHYHASSCHLSITGRHWGSVLVCHWETWFLWKCHDSNIGTERKHNSTHTRTHTHKRAQLKRGYAAYAYMHAHMQACTHARTHTRAHTHTAKTWVYCICTHIWKQRASHIMLKCTSPELDSLNVTSPPMTHIVFLSENLLALTSRRTHRNAHTYALTHIGMHTHTHSKNVGIWHMHTHAHTLPQSTRISLAWPLTLLWLCTCSNHNVVNSQVT
jgi:hypothetical protein